MNTKNILCSVSFLACIILFQSNVKFCSGQLQYRLDKNIIPESYDIKIKPYFLKEDGSKRFTFDGEVKITLHTFEQNAKIITLHKDLIEIQQATLFESENEKLVQNIDEADMAYENETEKLSIHLRDALFFERKYVLYFKYTGVIRDGVDGFYRANYLGADGKEKLIVLTQSQRINARTIVPCWDEPAFKAKFRLQISRPRDYISVFNSRLLDSRADENYSNRYWDTFEWTPAMSTYLFAFMITQYVKRGDENLQIVTRPEHYEFTEFTYNVAKKAIVAYDNYTKHPYNELGNTILQMAGSPKFPYNGMENWGLVIYKDNVLIQEPNYSDGWKDKQYTIMILVHEIAHMWFGNSVTFAWWSYFWLNEGFARYYQYYISHELYPEYQLDQQFVVKQLQMIFERDALNSTLPLSTPEALVHSPEEIGNVFSSIAYAKGASIIRMFKNLMGQENFDTAIQNYLIEFHLKSTVPSDLLKHLKQHWPKEQQLDLDEFFLDWTEKVGLPVVAVSLSEDRKQVTLRQQRFLLSPNDGSDGTLKYTIPITYATNTENNFNELAPKQFFNTNKANLSIQLEQSIDWIIFNIQQSNYYRVFYDSNTLKSIFNAVNKPQHSGIHVINRAQIIDDLLNLAFVGIMDYADVFQYLEYLSNELDYLPWEATFTSLPRVSQRLTVEQQRHFGKFLDDITMKIYDILGFNRNKDSILDVYNRNNIVHWKCKYGNTHCNQEAQKALLTAKEENKYVAADFRETVYCSAIRFGEFRYYEIVDQWYRKEKQSSEKLLLLRSLSCTANFLDYHYARILAGDFPEELIPLTLKPLYAENAENVGPMLDAIISTYDRLAERLGGFSKLAEVIMDLSQYITIRKQREKLENFTTDHRAEFGKSVDLLDKASKTVGDNIKWAEERLGGLLKYLESRSSASSFKHFSIFILIAFGICLSNLLL